MLAIVAIFVLGVSIHARVWRATEPESNCLYLETVSIHARVWRATDCTNSWQGTNAVSIHARVWRATRDILNADYTLEFQSTPAYGGRPPDVIN